VPSITPELIIFCLYVLAGPLAWGLFGLAVYSGRRRMLLMRRPPIPPDDPPAVMPRVTIMIPAKDEGERIRACIESALSQDYPDFDVIAVDDRSTDNTGAVMDDLAARFSKLGVIHITQPPAPGWTGKNNALHTAARRAEGEWLLFVDSDVILERDALSAAMAVVLRKKFDLISLLPKLESHSVWESLLVPLAASAASSMYLISLTNTQHTRTAFANGQFLMISRPAYDAIGRHEVVRDRYCEDVEIARLVKEKGLRPRVSWGNEFCAVRMYSSLPGIIRGWSRIYYAARVGSPWRVLAASAFVIGCGFSVYAALAWAVYRFFHTTGHWPGPLAWLIASLIHLGILTTVVSWFYSWSGNPRRNALLFPVGGSLLLGIFARALQMCVTKKVEWRGTAYSHTMAAQLDPGRTP
jgi:cellulose synthase/poly-beta-1,6-N-acetylglucosamine synthase-like glycosyltransferase